jgi:predicted porin
LGLSQTRDAIGPGKTNFKGEFGMQKKLLAVAVAGALAAPLLAQAASSGSTVQIYGQAEWEYGRLEQGRGRPSVDYNESTGSFLGFRGTESLGGGLSAWFQCETTMDIRGFDQVGLCSRHSAVGLRGGFGSIWGGRWATPFSDMLGVGLIGHEATGNLGFARVYGATGSTSIVDQNTGSAGVHAVTSTSTPNAAITGAIPGAAVTTTNTIGSASGGGANRAQFRRREACLTTYQTPNMGGFMAAFAVSCGNAAAHLGGGAIDGRSNTKPRLWSTAARYTQGPLAVGFGYEKHVDVGTFNSATAPSLDDRAWGLSGRYTVGPVRLGVMYLDRKWETGAGTHVKNRTYTLGAEWTIAGPHQLHFSYGATGDSKGVGAVGIGGQGGAAAPGADTGYDAVTLAYQYNFSKRTSAKLGWIRYDNEANTSAVRPYNAAGAAPGFTANGQAFDAWSLVVKHRF